LRDKNPCSKSGQYGLEVENNKISIWSLNLWKLQFSLWTLEKL
jgi:hypothetical protein